MAQIEFKGRDLVAWFREHPSNGQEWQYRVRYECANQSVVHYVSHTEYQSVDSDGMRVYKDALAYEENVAAGLTRSPRVYFATQDAGGKWSDEREIESYNPAPPVPVMSVLKGFDMAVFNFEKPVDSDWMGFCVWADTQTPVRKDQVTTKYIGPDNSVTMQLAPDTTYYVTYAAYDAFGTDLLNEATVEITTLSEESYLLPILNQKLEAIAALNVERSTAFAKLTNAYSVSQDRKLQRAEERLNLRIDENGVLIAERVLELETQFDDFQSVFQEQQQTQAGENFALSESIRLMGARVGNVEGAITEEARVRVEQDQALAELISQQAVKIDDNESQFNDRIQTLVNEDNALALRITNQSAQWNTDIDGKITAASQTINQTIANGDEALSQRIDTLSAQMGDDGWQSALQEERNVRAAADQTNSNSIISLSSRLNDQGGVTLEQKLSTFGSSINGFGAQYTLRIDNNGIISGFGLVSNPNGNSEFAINADRFVIGHPGSLEKVFEVVGGQVRIRQALIDRMTVNQAQIQNLTVGTNQIAINAVTLTHNVRRSSVMYGTGVYQEAIVYNFNAPYACYLTMIVTGSQGFPNGDKQWNIRLFGNGSELAGAGGMRHADSFAITGYMYVNPGNHEIRLMWQGANSVNLADLKCTILEMRR